MYSTPKDTIQHLIEVKNSRFIGTIAPADDRASAMAALHAVQQQYPDASHHCWAYQIGTPGNPKTVAFSDDGEPSNSAGKPILNVVQHSDASDLIAIVTRYFGGKKLGVGGLIRAYGDATRQALDRVTLIEKLVFNTVELSLQFAEEQPCRHFVSKLGGNVTNVEYNELVKLTCEIPLDQTNEFNAIAHSYGWVMAE